MEQGHNKSMKRTQTIKTSHINFIKKRDFTNYFAKCAQTIKRAIIIYLLMYVCVWIKKRFQLRSNDLYKEVRSRKLGQVSWNAFDTIIDNQIINTSLNTLEYIYIYIYRRCLVSLGWTQISKKKKWNESLAAF